MTEQANQDEVEFGINTYRQLLDFFVMKANDNIHQALLSIVLFGSVSRGQATRESDIDVFVYFDDDKLPRADVTIALNKIILSLRGADAHMELQSRLIFPEIYPFIIGKSKSNQLPWVCLDSSVEGIVLFDTHGFGRTILTRLQRAVQSGEMRRTQLRFGGWCWFIEKNTGGQIMDKIERSDKLMFAAEESLAQAEFSIQRNSYNLAIRRAQEAVELALSSILAALGVHNPKNHDMAPLLFNVLKSYAIETSSDINAIQAISIDLSRKRGPALHQDEGFSFETAESAISDAQYVLEFSRAIKDQI